MVLDRGKSTLAARLFANIKINTNYKCELISEYAKDLTYEKRFDTIKNDQLYILAKQNHKIKIIESYNEPIDLIITDSPLLLANIYGELNCSIDNNFKQFTLNLFNSYKNFNIFIERPNNKNNYETYGRNESFEDAQLIDDKIINTLNINNIPFIFYEYTKSINDLYKEIKEYLEFDYLKRISNNEN